MSIIVCTGAHSFCNTCILFPVPVNCSCSSNYTSDKWYSPDRQQLVFVFIGVEVNWILFNCTCCCIIINFINDTEAEFIWRTLLNMSQGTANPKQNLQNDLYVLERFRSDYAVRVVWSASSLKKPWVLGSHTAAARDSGKTAQRCRLTWVFAGLTYCFVCVGQQPAACAPQARALIAFKCQNFFHWLI